LTAKDGYPGEERPRTAGAGVKKKGPGQTEKYGTAKERRQKRNERKNEGGMMSGTEKKKKGVPAQKKRNMQRKKRQETPAKGEILETDVQNEAKNAQTRQGTWQRKGVKAKSMRPTGLGPGRLGPPIDKDKQKKGRVGQARRRVVQPERADRKGNRSNIRRRSSRTYSQARGALNRKTRARGGRRSAPLRHPKKKTGDIVGTRMEGKQPRTNWGPCQKKARKEGENGEREGKHTKKRG